MESPAVGSDDDKRSVMKNTRHPNFFLGIVTILLVLIGIGLKANGYREGDYVLIGSTILGGIHWIWGIIDVIGNTDMKAFQKRFWLILTVAIPALGALLFYVLHQTKDKITT